MPVGNNFQHSKYSRADPGNRVAWLEFEPGASPDSQVWREAMGKVGLQLASAGVRAVLFVSGMPYADPFGSERLDEAGGGLNEGILEGFLAWSLCWDCFELRRMDCQKWRICPNCRWIIMRP